MSVERLIVVAGMSRGGTNLLWNLIQSHPSVIDTYYELNQLFGRATNVSFIDKLRVETSALLSATLPRVPGFVRSRIRRFAALSFNSDRQNREKYPGVQYTPEELEGLVPCTKLVSSWEANPLRTILRRNDALKYLPLLHRSYSDIHVIFIIRNGLSLMHSWGRRGAPTSVAATWYRRYVLAYERYSETFPNRSMIVKHEDLLADPFGLASLVFNFSRLEPTRLNHLRVAIKPTFNNRVRSNATEKKKIWVDRSNFSRVLDVSVNQAQIDQLASSSVDRFIGANADILTKYGYL